MTAEHDRTWIDRLRLRACFPRRRVLIIPPGPQGSVGDEAATQMLVGVARELGAERIGVVSYAPGEDWGFGAADSGVELVSVPSWPFDRVRWALPSMAAVLRDFDHVVIAGADCIDGGYSEEGTCALLDLGRWADGHGCRVAFVNCSFNARPTVNAVQALRDLPQRIAFWLRDDLSAESFARATGRATHVGAEIAFLTTPVAGDGAARSWVIQQRKAGHRIVVLVPNPLVGTSEPLRSPQRSPDPYLDVLARMRRDDLRFVVLPNDAREVVGDLPLAQAIMAGLPETMRERVFLVPHPMPAPLLCEFFRHVDVLVGARFHALVIALTAGIPVVGLEYQGKVRGMLRMCGLEEFSIPCENGIVPATIAARLEDALVRNDELRHVIADVLPTLRRRARSMMVGALAGGT